MEPWHYAPLMIVQIIVAAASAYFGAYLKAKGTARSITEQFDEVTDMLGKTTNTSSRFSLEFDISSST
jgi:hypothetical protein